MCFCVLRRISKWLQKIAGKQFLPKFRQNCSTSHCFQDKLVLIFYTEFHNGHQKWWGKRFLAKTARRLHIHGTKNVVEIALSGTVSDINVL